MKNFRKPNIFEYVILIVGILLIIAGYIFIHKLVVIEGFGWTAIMAIFLWMILLAQLILIAVNENVKEELKQLIILNLEENKILRKELTKKAKKKNNKK